MRGGEECCVAMDPLCGVNFNLTVLLDWLRSLDV